ncbi:MAG: glycoside hydrolase family 9 protein [Kiritimatiellae bacterium]|nr:glycoside hydrolase family 9 protein [Kiritimatiellia bacterium]
MPPGKTISALACAISLAGLCATRETLLDPYTSLVQTDDGAVAAPWAAEPGYWRTPMGLKDPASGNPQARVIHNLFRKSSSPLPGWSVSNRTALVKVNQVGYLPSQKKYAYIGGWLGPVFGAWRPAAPLGRWRIADAAGGRTVFASETPPVHRVDDVLTKEGVPWTGEFTFEIDFSSVTNEGTYFAEIEGVGRSMDFRISAGAAEEAFRVHMEGLFGKRCGRACHQSVVRGRFAPEEGTLPKGTRWFDVIANNTAWDGPRLPACGGWHDAADFDRRPAHLRIVNALCAVYLMKPENFRDGQLAVPESGNGIPDILDEADWGLNHLLSLQQADGGVGTWIETTRHPVPGESAPGDTLNYAVSRATRASSLEYAAHASLLARCHESFRGKYLESAKRAWDYAIGSEPASETYFIRRAKRWGADERQVVYWDEEAGLPSQPFIKAAVNLAALTGDGKYLRELKVRRKELMEEFRKNEWRWEALALAGERELGFPREAGPFVRAWESKLLNRAAEMLKEVDGAYAYRVPWWFPNRGWSHAMGWGQSHPSRRAQTLVAVHRITGERRYLDAAIAAFDFHNGCNPVGSTLTSGLGTVYPVVFLDLPSYVDGVAEYARGITPYRWTYGQPPKAIEMVYGKDRTLAVKCPIWRRWGNLENQTVAASEFTVWETIAPAAALAGYLIDPASATPPPAPRPPAARLEDLPGYWLAP